jgi:predicted ATPase
MGLPYLMGLLGGALAGAGQRDRAISMVGHAIDSARQNGSQLLLSEIVRTKAEMVAQRKDRDDKEVEALFRSAVEMATKQGAPLPGLRAATGWARFLVQRRQRAQARAVLQPYAHLIAGLDSNPDATAAAELV